MACFKFHFQRICWKLANYFLKNWWNQIKFPTKSNIKVITKLKLENSGFLIRACFCCSAQLCRVYLCLFQFLLTHFMPGDINRLLISYWWNRNSRKIIQHQCFSTFFWTTYNQKQNFKCLKCFWKNWNTFLHQSFVKSRSIAHKHFNFTINDDSYFHQSSNAKLFIFSIIQRWKKLKLSF